MHLHTEYVAIYEEENQLETVVTTPIGQTSLA